MKINYRGTKWYKCDLHLHTPESKCFRDRSITARQWVDRAIEQGLNCVAVSDHNSGNWIDLIKTAAVGTTLTVFPGVEITCDTSKVHLLVLFNVIATSQEVNDFIMLCGINRSDFAEQTASTIKTIFEIAGLANNCGAIVIPAHVDEYNGLESISAANINQFYDLSYVNAVQVVHKDFLDVSLVTNNNTALKDALNSYYPNPSPAIDFAQIGNWHRPVREAIKKKLAITTFSDNPHAVGDSKHGLDGIGKRFTWIKMDDTPTLEGLRQAFVLSEFRIKNDFECPGNPYELPALWFKSIAIKGTTITDPLNILKVEFSPQLTTIIGGRGSGKSSILRFIRGLFNRTIDLLDLKEIIADHADFYKKVDSRSQKGVLTDDTEIEIEFVRNNVIHRLTAKNITNSDNQTIVIEKFDSVTGTWSIETGEGYISFFLFEQYSQKQIYEIAQEPNCLRERIDNAIVGMDLLKANRETLKNQFLEKSASIRTIRQQISGKGVTQTEISDLNDRINLFQESGIATLITNKDKFTSQDTAITQWVDDAIAKEEILRNAVDNFTIADIDFTGFDEEHIENLKEFTEPFLTSYATIKSELEVLLTRSQALRTSLETSLETTIWNTAFIQNQTEFETQKTELEGQGINDILNFESLTEQRTLKENELERINDIEASLEIEISERTNLRNRYVQTLKDITAQRTLFASSNLQSDRVKVGIKPFRNKLDFTQKLRKAIGRPTGFDIDVDTLTNMCFSGNVENKLLDIIELFKKLKKGEAVNGVSGYFVNLVPTLGDPQIDEIELLFPEDEIDIQYKPSDGARFKPLSTASAGQKTTAVLTLILSQGTMPLILDQPEDDLDNRLVYELIVDRLKHAKERRQIIVVTHNANIPVNGDAEFIVSMNSESKKLEILYEGTVEEESIKKEICDVMEGSKQAFEMRSVRYQNIT
jgi:ABC-type cobalamin/Fe3+-siderophores transport system ATPase subunit